MLEAFTTINPEQTWLEVSPEQFEETMPSQQEYSYDVAHSTAFTNRLTLNTFVNWFNTESGIDEQLKVWPSLDALPSIWEMVNGTAIQLGETRVVLIPSQEIDINEFCVPAEWVDIPSWAADYYLAVQVSPEDCWLRICGYTTHKKLKQAGRYDKINRTYSLEQEELIEDLNVMWVARSFGCDCKAAIKPLPSLSQAQAENLLAQLSQRSCYSPRLKVDFEQWARLMENEKWRQHLYERRIAQAVPPQPLVNLSQWFSNVFEECWQTVEDIFAPTELIPVLSSRNPEPDRESKLKAIASIIPLLNPHHEELLRRQAAGVLGKIGVGSHDVSIALTELLHTARDEQTRWQAAISLGKVNPNHPEAGRQRAKLIDLGVQLGGYPVALVVAVMPKTDGKVNVFLQVQPTKVETLLPPGMKLGLLSESDEMIREVEARKNALGQGKDESIQLAFSCSSATHFRVKVTWNNVSFTESFVI
jgi:hypothetical protein